MTDRKTLLIGTENPSKGQLMGDMAKRVGVEPVFPSDLGLSLDDAENARTAEGNAMQKALAWRRLTRLPVLTEDSGLVFLDLPPEHPDQPGVLVRRAAGHVMTDEEMFAWFAALARRHGGRLRGSWQDAWCLLPDETRVLTCVDTPEELEAKAFTLLDHPVHDRVTPGWPLERLIVRSEDGVSAREQNRERVLRWLSLSLR